MDLKALFGFISFTLGKGLGKSVRRHVQRWDMDPSRWDHEETIVNNRNYVSTPELENDLGSTMPHP